MRPAPRANPRDLCCAEPSPSYAESPPPPALATSVDFFWTLTIDGSPHRILPDGAMDLMVDLDRRTAIIVGARDTPLSTRPTRSMRLWGARLHPGAARAVLGIPPRAFLNGDAPLDALDGVLPRALRARLDAEPEALLPAALATLIGAHARAPDARVMRAVRALRASLGATSVTAIADAIGVGARQLERLFAEHVGVSPKGLARLIRFGESVRLSRRETPPWSAIACALGYADQAHLSREFRAFAGISPGRFRASSAMSGSFKTAAAAEPTFGASRQPEEKP